MILCIEGIDACGKTTQAQRLATRLNAPLLHFPDYETPSGRLIGQHLQSAWHGEWHSGKESFKALNALLLQSLMLTNRMEKAAQIARAGQDGRDLVLSRYWPSGVVYGGADGLDFDWLIDIHRHLPPANHYVLLDIQPELSAQRRPGRRDRYERQPGLMQEVAERYRKLWSAAQHHAVRTKWHVLNGNDTIEDLEEQIWKIAQT